MNIVYLPKNKIDKTKWDKSVFSAANGLVYAYSWYLDALAGNWDAIVINDYEYVMPLPWRKKFGFQYLFQPDLTPVLGLFGTGVSKEIFRQTLEAIPSKFKLWDISLNHFNTVPAADYTVYRRSNYVLSLKEEYSLLKNRYNNNCVRNIKKAVSSECMVRKNIPVAEVIKLAKEQFKTFTEFDEKNFQLLEKIFVDYLEIHNGITYGIYNKTDMLIASSAFLFSHGRAYYWLVGNHPAAKEVAASFLLIDKFIEDHSGENLVMDFEGSDTDSIAKFYKSFGANDEPYSTIYYSKLPALLRLFKKDPYKH